VNRHTDTVSEVSRDRIYAETWAPSHEAPATFTSDATAEVTAAEDGDWNPRRGIDTPSDLALVDGTRRVEINLWRHHSHDRVPGLAGAYAVGAAVLPAAGGSAFSGVRTSRVCIWGEGHTGGLGPQNGYRWEPVSTAAEDMDGVVNTLQNMMRDAEGRLAVQLAEAGWLVVLDGPLNHLYNNHLPVVGYVKRHQRRLLPAEQHNRVPELEIGERSPLWAVGEDRYTAYLRVGATGPVGDPWGGVVRLECHARHGLDAAIAVVDKLAGTLPRFAGVHHRDPRAPQNLTPIKALEAHLGNVLGSKDLATRVARDAVAAQQYA
jgi:uncharacterized protein